jgi:hypothetical protein
MLLRIQALLLPIKTLVLSGPISRSAKPFCQGEPGATGLSRMPMARNRRVTMPP